MTFSASTQNQPFHFMEEQLQLFVIGELTLSVEQQKHLDSCLTCQQHLAAIEQLHHELAVARRSEPSATAKERYLALFREAAVNVTDPLSALAHQVTNFVDAVRAAVMWNGRERLAMQGVRNVGATSYRMLYSTEHAEIELMIEPVAGNFKIEGEVLPLDTAIQNTDTPDSGTVQADRALFPMLLELHTSDANPGHSSPLFVGESDEEGRFHIPAMPAGVYTIYLAPVDGAALLIEPLELA